jgi:hypothetical protein
LSTPTPDATLASSALRAIPPEANAVPDTLLRIFLDTVTKHDKPETFLAEVDAMFELFTTATA